MASSQINNTEILGSPIQFENIQGQIDTAGITMEKITRPGVSGVAFHDTGFRAGESEIVTTEKLASLPAADAAILEYSSLQGNLVSVVDDFGTERTNIMVIKVTAQQPFAVGPSSDGTTVAIVKANWRVQDTATS